MDFNTSKEQMEKELHHLGSIKRVSPNADLFSKIEKRIEARQKPTIPLFWARTAAAVLICLLCTEIFVVINTQQKHSQTDISEVLPVSNNLLYYD